MNRFPRRFLLCLFGACSVWAQPALRATDPVSNAASYAKDVAPGSIFVVIGSNLSGDNVVVATEFPLRTSMNDTSIQFAPVGSGTPIAAYMIYTTRNQVAGLLPSTTTPGMYDVTVTYRTQRTPQAARVQVVARNVGIFTANQAGFGQAQALNRGTLELNRFTSGRLGQFTTMPANPGMRVDLYGTGVGADPQSDSTGGTSGDQTAAANVRVRVGAREVPALYAGRSQGTSGLDQIVFNLPADVETGCTVSAQVLFGSGQTSNTFTLSVAAPGQSACSHPSLSEESLRRLSEGGSLTMGSLFLTKLDLSLSVPPLGTFDTSSETFSGSFARFGIGDVGNFPGTQTASGQCQTFRRRGGITDVIVGAVPVTPLDAGAQLTLNGPNANNVAVPRDATSKIYVKTLFQGSAIPGVPAQGTPVIAAGTYRVTGTGGADVGAFNASVDVPAPLNWTNKGSISTVPRSQPLNITWTGGGNNMVMITGISGSQVGGTQENPFFDVGVFVCTAPAAAGNFTVPPSVLSVLPAASGDLLAGSAGILGISVSGSPSVGRFTAPLTAGGNVDFSQFNYTIGANKTVAFQ